MLFDTGPKGIGVVEVDTVHELPDGTRVGKKDVLTDHAVTYLVYPRGHVCTVRTKIADKSPEAHERMLADLRRVCDSIPYGRVTK